MLYKEEFYYFSKGDLSFYSQGTVNPSSVIYQVKDKSGKILGSGSKDDPGIKEITIPYLEYLYAKDPGSTPFGEKADRSHACAAAFSREVDGLAKLAEFLRGAERKGWEWWDRECSVSCHEFKKGNRLYVAFQNVSSVKKRIHSCPTQYFRPLLSLPDGSAFKSEMVQSSMSSVAYDIEPHGFLFVESEMGVL